MSAGDGDNLIITGTGNDTITSGAGSDNVTSGAGNDTITTGSGNDVINAGAGNDIVNAGTGNDRVIAGAGTDTLIGGGGHDTFMYRNLAEAAGADTISDFITSSPTAAGEGDTLNLTGLVSGFTDLSGGTLAQLVASGHIDFSAGSGSTVISFDSNGSALGGSTGVLVTLTGVAFTSEADSVIAFADNLLV